MKFNKYYKRYIVSLTLLLLLEIFKTNNVFALNRKDFYYQNNNGVSFSKEDYNFFSEMYWNGYQDIVTLEEYESVKSLNVIGVKVETKYLEEFNGDIKPLGTIINRNDRTLKISKACTSTCFVTVNFSWLKNPSVRSYDTIGAYLDGTSLIGNPSTTIVVNNSRISVTDLRKEANGIGSSFKLPSGSNPKITQAFQANKGGHIYASYQHAMQNSTLTISKDYTFSKLGYGSVFKFSNNSRPYYDGMNGVDIEV